MDNLPKVTNETLSNITMIVMFLLLIFMLVYVATVEHKYNSLVVLYNACKAEGQVINLTSLWVR